MPHKRFSQQGFTASTAMLFVIMITLIVGVSYYIYDASKTSATTTKINQTPADQPSSKAAKFLDIPEWGVRIPIPKAAPDLYALKAADNTGSLADGPGGNH